MARVYDDEPHRQRRLFPFNTLQLFTFRKVRKSMETNSGPSSEVLHSENHSKLSSEQVAKALARHNKNHSAAKAENIAGKANKAPKR
jgi:hypothetical protein